MDFVILEFYFRVKSQIFDKRDIENHKIMEKKVTHFSKILKELIRLTNFNSAMAVHLALESQEVGKIIDKTYEDRVKYIELFSTLNNYQTYRATLLESVAPGIPFL